MGRLLKDYTGKICGCWLVKERDLHPASKSHETFWICECQNCGNITSVRKTDLDREPQSCNNCKQDHYKIGEKYGLLTIIDKAKPRNNHTYVKVQCDCGSEPFEIRLSHLKGQNHSRTTSCGCLNESAGELKIRQILENANINFQSQYRIRDKNSDLMIFDFTIFDDNNNILKCIEYNGEQHYKPIKWFGGEEAFKKQQIRDNRKTEYCNTHNIFLQWISYLEYDNINIEMLLSLS